MSGALDALVRKVAHAYAGLPVRPGGRMLHRLLRRYMRRRGGRDPFVADVGGIRYQLDLGEVIDANLYFRGSYEPRATETVRVLVSPGMVALDVGANSGYYTLTLARLVGEGGTVIAFEPTALAVGRLEANLALNSFRNVVVEKVALSDRPETREVRPDELAFRASFRLDGKPAARAPEVVTFERLDDYVSRSGVGRVDFVKADVDGNELRVVRGGARTLGEQLPIVLIEIDKRAMRTIGDDPVELAELLWQLGYGFESDDRHRSFASPEELVRALPEDALMLVLCTPRAR